MVPRIPLSRFRKKPITRDTNPLTRLNAEPIADIPFRTDATRLLKIELATFHSRRRNPDTEPTTLDHVFMNTRAVSMTKPIAPTMKSNAGLIALFHNHLAPDPTVLNAASTMFRNVSLFWYAHTSPAASAAMAVIT